MARERRIVIESAQARIAGLGLLAFLCWTATSWARWANFGYRTFDLAYYAQALWQLSHGRFDVSVQYVPLLGNHVEPIMFLVAPFFFVFRHPMLLVVVQNAALGAMGPIGYGVARRLGFGNTSAFLLSAALLLAPATGYVALHEFHPEALTAPFLLLMLRARLADRRAQHWLWFLAALACKENMAPLLAAYCLVQLAANRKRGYAELAGWFLWPMIAALFWFVACTKFITPAFNAGNIDYTGLYERLGSSGGEILRNAIVKPQLILTALETSLRQGNLLTALLLPFLGLPLLRPKWLLIATPVILQHLLSWRSSEWTIYFHYAAPLLPIFWFASLEGLTTLGKWAPRTAAAPALMLAACVGGQILIGPVGEMRQTARAWFAGQEARARKQAILALIPAHASVMAPLPYLSHLALRQELHSLHFVLKGLKTLSRASFDPPPPTDYVLIDYSDSATFDPVAGYYHPTMRALGGRIIPSSDRLLHEFLRRADWEAQSTNELTLLHRVAQRTPAATAEGVPIFTIGNHIKLLAIQKSGEVLSRSGSIEVKSVWLFDGERGVFPWIVLRLMSPALGSPILLQRGLCVPQAGPGISEDRWEIRATAGLPPGEYGLEALFIDNSKSAWAWNYDPSRPDPPLLVAPIPLGTMRVE